MHYSSSPFLKRPDECDILNGCNVDYKTGAITKDLGYSQVGDLAETGKNITGLYNFRQSSSVQKMLATVNDSGDNDTQLFYSTGGNWTEVAAAETDWANKAGINVEMEAMDGRCYLVGWGSTDGFVTPSSLATTTFDQTNCTSMPNAKYIKRYRDRIYIGNCDIGGTAYPYRVYYSTVPSSGSITWTVAKNFIDVDYSEAITGLGENWDRLIVFTEYSAYFYNQSSWKKVWDVGCTNNRTIKNSGAFLIWANADGVWTSTGNRPLNISAKVIDFIRSATPANFFAEVVDEEYHLYIGDVTVDGIAYTNVRLTFNIPHQTWRMRELADTATIFAKYNNSGKIELWHGDSDGEVMKYSKYTDTTPVYTDDGAGIKSQFQHVLLDFGVPEQRKHFTKMLAYAERAQGLKLQARVVDKNERVLTPWKKLGNCTKYINEFTVNPDKGHLLQIEGRETSTNPYWQLLGFSIDIRQDTNKK